MPVPMTEAPHHLRRRAERLWRVAGLKACERLELLCAVLGSKPLVRLVADDITAGHFAEVAEWLGLRATPSSVRQAPVLSVFGDVYTRTVARDDPQGRWFSFFMARDSAVLAEAVRLEASGADSEQQGLLLGYPPCCVESYRAIRAGGDWVELILDRWTSDITATALANPLARLFNGDSFLPDLFPCSLGCPAALRLAEASWLALEAVGRRRDAEVCLRSLCRPIVRVGRRGLVQLGAVWRDGTNLEFDPAEVRTFGPLPEDFATGLGRGRISLGEAGAATVQLITFSDTLPDRSGPPNGEASLA